MRFIIDADMPRRVVELVVSHGHEALDVRDIGLGSADDRQIADHARNHGLCLITCDFGFADIRNYPPIDYSGLVVLQLPKNATGDAKLAIVETLLRQPSIMARLPGRLAIVAAKGIRLRPI